MKKFLSLSMLVASMAFVSLSAEAKTTESTNVKNVTVSAETSAQPGRWNRRMRVTTTVRTVRRGRTVYRETYRTTRFPNGRVTTTLVSRVRVR